MDSGRGGACLEVSMDHKERCSSLTAPFPRVHVKILRFALAVSNP